jgi:Type IV secretory system Conjugative DNA transfer
MVARPAVWPPCPPPIRRMSLPRDTVRNGHRCRRRSHRGPVRVDHTALVLGCRAAVRRVRLLASRRPVRRKGNPGTGGRVVPASLGVAVPVNGPDTHRTAHFGTTRDAARIWRRSCPKMILYWVSCARRRAGPIADSVKMGICSPAPRPAPAKASGAVIPNLLDYPGLAFVLDFKGETYAVTAWARRGMDRDVILIDPFGITGAVHLNRPERSAVGALLGRAPHRLAGDPRLCAALGRSDFRKSQTPEDDGVS